MSTRLSVLINNETNEAIRQLMADEDTSATEIIRRAVAVYHFVQHETASGKTLRLIDLV